MAGPKDQQQLPDDLEPLPPLTAGEKKALDRLLDRVEDRIFGSERGLHMARPAASEADLRAAEALGLSEACLTFWARFDGIEMGHGEARIYRAAELDEQSRMLREQLRARPGDIAIGHYGRDELVACVDPWAEGADIVLVDESGQRGPYGSSVAASVLAILGELSVLLDEGGEFHEELFGDDGELLPSAERRLLRRHLDMDPDAPLARFRLAQLLRREGEAKAARRELELCLRRAPEFAWAHFELGRACLDLGDAKAARKAFDEARGLVQAAGDEDALLAAYFAAWAALAAAQQGDDATRSARAEAVLEANPGFVRAQEAGANEALEDEVPGRARELVELGLAVSPKDLSLLALRKVVARAAAKANED